MNPELYDRLGAFMIRSYRDNPEGRPVTCNRSFSHLLSREKKAAKKKKK